jgi:hypothetical protein
MQFGNYLFVDNGSREGGRGCRGVRMEMDGVRWVKLSGPNFQLS